MKEIIDTHAHLDQLENLDQALNNACREGVVGIVCVSMDLASCKKNLEIKKTTHSPKIYLAMGMHPSEAYLEEVQPIIQLIRDNASELTAIGEIGLDFWYKWVRKDKEKKDIQRKVYQTFLELAKELQLPVIIHSRGTWQECVQTAKEIGIKKAEFHWYSGPIDVLDEILSCGYFISTTPSLAYSPPSREAINHAPIENTLIETDSPVFFQTAVSARDKNKEPKEGFLAEPKDVFKTLKAYCELKNIDEQRALEVLNKNAEDFFSLN